MHLIKDDIERIMTRWEIFVTEHQWGNIQRLFGDSIVSHEEIKTPSPTTPEQLPKE